MAKPKKIDGVSFYAASVEGKTEAQFIKHEKHHGLTDDQLKKAYATLTAKTAKTNQALNNATADENKA